MSDELQAESTRFEMVPHWIMEHPRITGNAVRLYLQLRRYAGREGTAFPSRKRLASDLNLALATIDAAIGVLVEIHAIRVQPRYTATGNQTSNLYVVAWDPPTQNLGRGATQNLGSPLPRNDDTNLYLPELDLPRETQPAAADDAATLTKRAQAITASYVQAVPLSKFVAVLGIVKKALQAGYEDEQVLTAVMQLASDGRPITVDVLRVQMEGLPPVSNLDRKRARQRQVLEKYTGREAIEA